MGPGVRRPPGAKQSGKRHHGLSGRLSACCLHAQDTSAGPDRLFQRQQCSSLVCHWLCGGQCEGTGAVTSQCVLTHNVKSLFWTGPLRSPARLQNTFAHESFMDEIATVAKADPVEYRLRHLRDPRLIEVVKSVAKAANWETRPSPRPGLRRTGVARGRGVSCVLYEGDNGYC